MQAGRAVLLLAMLPALALSGCDRLAPGSDQRAADARDFPRADRPVAPIVSTRWSSEARRDALHEAEEIMDEAGVTAGMTVADIGAGEGYYTVRLARRVGPRGRVLAEDIVAEVIDALGQRITRENLSNVSVKLGTPADPKLPPGSFDRIFMVHMYHEISEPYALLWHLHSALKPKGEVIVVEGDQPVERHGMPPALLRCEFEAVGYVEIGFIRQPAAGGYLARFSPGAGKPIDPNRIIACRLRRPGERGAPGTVDGVAAP